MLANTVAILHDNTVHGDDSYLVRSLGEYACLDAVMDGVTGRHGGEASRAVMEALATASLTSPDDVVTVLEAVNQRLYQRGWGHWWLTTASVALCLDGTLSVVGAGDSPVFLIRSDTCQPLFSHIRGFGRTGTVRALGAGPRLCNLYRADITLEPNDRVVLATDGVTENITRCELVGIIRQAASPQAAAEHLTALLVTRCRTDQPSAPRGGSFRRDDWTAIVRFFGHKE